MRCYYQVRGEGCWRRGEAAHTGAGKELHFHSRDDEGRVAHEITLWNAEVFFHGPGFDATGLVPAGPGLYRLETVVAHLHKPREGP